MKTAARIVMFGACVLCVGVTLFWSDGISAKWEIIRAHLR